MYGEYTGGAVLCRVWSVRSLLCAVGILGSHLSPVLYCTVLYGSITDHGLCAVAVMLQPAHTIWTFGKVGRVP